MSDITIVTAFFDIGRSDWSVEKGYPHYLKRTTETYLDRFAILAKLDNPMVIYTSPDLEYKIKQLRGDRKTTIFTIEFDNFYVDLRKKIGDIQKSPLFRNQIDPKQLINPEYWNPDYVLINTLKSTFVRMAFQEEVINTELAAWMDFGYCRNVETLNGLTEWKYNFDSNKIHVFSLREMTNINVMNNLIFNKVYITGPCIVSGKEKWIELEDLIFKNLHILMDQGFVDDDQGLLTMSYLTDPDLFDIHMIKDSEWFIAFKEYSK